MDLIYTDKNRIEQGVLQNFAVDFDTTNKKDFQITVGIKNNVLQGGFYWYIEGTEYGGKVDGYEVLTETNEIRYTGRNFRGILETKVIEPPTGQDHKIVSGNMQDVVSGLIADESLQDIFVVDASDVVVSNHKINRYVTLYEGISAIATRYGLIPSFVVKDGKVHVSFRQSIDYSDANEYTQDDLNFSIKRSFADVNHLICLGQGELKDRTVVHLYADAEGNVSETQSLFGIDEVVAVYENTNAEDANILKTEGIEKLNELKNTDRFEVTIPDIDLQIGDIIGGIERVTNTYVARQIVNVIAKITDTRIDLEYKVGEDSAKSKTTSQSTGTSSGSSGGGGGGSFNLSPATKTTLGGVIIGDNINVDASGRISVTVTKGDKGDAGADGYSPTVTTSKSGKATTITITDKNGIKTATVNDGADGQDGVSVSSIMQTTTSTDDGGTNVITATLSDGTKTTFNIKNGSKGSKGDKGDAGKDGVNAASEFEGYTPSDFANANHTHSSYVNQNAFSNVKVGNTTIAADTTTDTLTIVAGDNVTITPDATNDKLTIAATSTTCTLGNITGVLDVSKGGTGSTTIADIFQNVLCSSGSNTSPEYVLAFDTNYVNNGYTTIKDLRNSMGLGNTIDALPIANGGTGATNATAALANLGLTATATELNYCDGVTSNIQTQINTLISNLIPSRDLNIIFQFGTVSHQGTYYSASVYVPKNTNITFSSAGVLGSSGNFISDISFNYSGHYLFITTTNANLAGRTISCVGTAS